MAQITAAQVKELRELTGAGMMDCKSALAEANGNLEEATKILRKKGLAAAAKKASRTATEGQVLAHLEEHDAVLVEVNCETDFVAQTDEFRELADGIAAIIASTGVSSVEQLMEQKWPGDAEGHTVAQVISSRIAKIGENITVRRFVHYKRAENAVFGYYIHANGKIGVLVEVKTSPGGAPTEAAEALAKEIAMHAAAAEPRFVRRDEVTENDLATEREIARDQALKSGKPEAVVEKIVAGKMEKFYGELVLLEQPYVRDDKMTVANLVAQRGKEAGANFEVLRFTRFKLGEGLQKRSDDFAAEVMAQVQS
ncbi:MAG: translation elongation factor Ts [Thermoanaerobaculia bacterium]